MHIIFDMKYLTRNKFMEIIIIDVIILLYIKNVDSLFERKKPHNIYLKAFIRVILFKCVYILICKILDSILTQYIYYLTIHQIYILSYEICFIVYCFNTYILLCRYDLWVNYFIVNFWNIFVFCLSTAVNWWHTMYGKKDMPTLRYLCITKY